MKKFLKKTKAKTEPIYNGLTPELEKKVFPSPRPSFADLAKIKARRKGVLTREMLQRVKSALMNDGPCPTSGWVLVSDRPIWQKLDFMTKSKRKSKSRKCKHCGKSKSSCRC